MHGWMIGTWMSAREGAKAVRLALRTPGLPRSPVLDRWTYGSERDTIALPPYQFRRPGSRPPGLPCTVFLWDVTFVFAYDVPCLYGTYMCTRVVLVVVVLTCPYYADVLRNYSSVLFYDPVHTTKTTVQCGRCGPTVKRPAVCQ